MKNKKQVWKKPQLRVFVKGEIEEQVLGTCKNSFSQGANSHGCNNNSDNCGNGNGYGPCKNKKWS
jgi:hypothetical protein